MLRFHNRYSYPRGVQFPEPSKQISAAALFGGVLCLLGWWWSLGDGSALSLVRGPSDQVSLPDHEARLLWTTLLWGVPAQLLLAVGLRGYALRLPRTWSYTTLYVMTMVALGFTRYVILDGAPLTDDEWAYQFQAATLAGFELWTTPPPDPTHFDYLFLSITLDRWYCYLQPGLALLMVPGQWLAGDGYLSLLPILAALVPATAALAQRLAGPEVRVPAGLMLLGSPWFILTGATVEPYGVLALLLVLSLLLAFRWLDEAQDAVGRRVVFMLGLVVGSILLLRGLEFGLVGLVMMGVFATRLLRSKRLGQTFGEGVIFLLGVLPFALIQLSYNTALTGDPLLPPIVAHVDTIYYGFGDDVYRGHSILDGLKLGLINAGRSVVWLAGPLWLFLLNPQGSKRVIGLLCLVGFWWVAWLPYSMTGVADFGPVYLFAIAPVLAVVIAIGGQSPWGRSLAFSAVITGLLTIGGWSIWQGHKITSAVNAPYVSTEAELGDESALVLIRRRYPAPTGWVFGIRTPTPTLDDPIIYGWATPSDLRPGGLNALKKRFPDRRVLVIDMDYGPSR